MRSCVPLWPRLACYSRIRPWIKALSSLSCDMPKRATSLLYTPVKSPAPPPLLKLLMLIVLFTIWVDIDGTMTCCESIPLLCPDSASPWFSLLTDASEMNWLRRLYGYYRWSCSCWCVFCSYIRHFIGFLSDLMDVKKTILIIFFDNKFLFGDSLRRAIEILISELILAQNIV